MMEITTLRIRAKWPLGDSVAYVDGIESIPASSALAGTALSRQGKGSCRGAGLSSDPESPMDLRARGMITRQVDKPGTLNGEP